MADITAKYLGDLRVECVHQQSGTVLMRGAITHQAAAR